MDNTTKAKKQRVRGGTSQGGASEAGAEQEEEGGGGGREEVLQLAESLEKSAKITENAVETCDMLSNAETSKSPVPSCGKVPRQTGTVPGTGATPDASRCKTWMIPNPTHPLQPRHCLRSRKPKTKINTPTDEPSQPLLELGRDCMPPIHFQWPSMKSTCWSWKLLLKNEYRLFASRGARSASSGFAWLGALPRYRAERGWFVARLGPVMATLGRGKPAKLQKSFAFPWPGGGNV